MFVCRLDFFFGLFCRVKTRASTTGLQSGFQFRTRVGLKSDLQAYSRPTSLFPNYEPFTWIRFQSKALVRLKPDLQTFYVGSISIEHETFENKTKHQQPQRKLAVCTGASQ